MALRRIDFLHEERSVPHQLHVILRESAASEFSPELDRWNERAEEMMQTCSSVPDDDSDYADVTYRLQQRLLVQLNATAEEGGDMASRILESYAASGTLSEGFAQSFRACRNWLRWNLQWYHTPIASFRSLDEFCIRLVEEQSIVAKEAAQVVFYTSFHDRTSCRVLVKERRILPRFLAALIRTDSVPMSLAIARNVHNIVVSFPGVAQDIESTRASGGGSTSCPWVPADEMSYINVFLKLLVHEGDDEELVVEILRCFYALRVGRRLQQDLGLRTAVFQHLERRQLASVAILMDAPSSLEIPIEPLTGLLRSCLVETPTVDIVAVTPVLAVLLKFCDAQERVRERVKSVVFPDEETYQKMAEAQRVAHKGKLKNVAPLDAPRGSLRFHLIQLLTSHESNVKRISAELLWILCGSSSQEFIGRVGMGNALPTLGQKGIVQLPSHVYAS